MHELIIWQKIHAELNKGARAGNKVPGDVPAMGFTALNGDSELLHN